jgi:uncharacterized damage-inducible protein DinB
MIVSRPGPDEYAPYYGTYVDKVPGTDALARLVAQRSSTAGQLAAIPEGMASYRYAPGKWSLREVVGHLADAERIFAYRLLRIARGDATPLASFDENVYVPEGRFERRPLTEVAAEFAAVRESTLALIRGLDEELLARMGVASTKPVSARALAYIIAGHEIHHMGVIDARYLA